MAAVRMYQDIVISVANVLLLWVVQNLKMRSSLPQTAVLKVSYHLPRISLDPGYAHVLVWLPLHMSLYVFVTLREKERNWPMEGCEAAPTAVKGQQWLCVNRQAIVLTCLSVYLTALSVANIIWVHEWMNEWMSEWLWSVGRMVVTEQIEVLGGKSAPVPHCPPPIPCGLAWDWT